MSKHRSPEHDLQTRCVAWFKYQYPYLRQLFFAVPNGGLRNKREAEKLRSEGVTPGVADIILQLPADGFHSLCVEMKAGRNGQSDEQRRYERACTIAGSRYIVIRTYDEFRRVLSGYVAACPPDIIEQLKAEYSRQMQESLDKSRQNLVRLIERQRLDERNECNTHL